MTIGVFDGAHLGHAALIRAGRRAVGPGGRVVAMCFSPHPASALNPGNAPEPLTTFAQRGRMLRSLGADAVVRLDPASGVLGLSAEAFIADVVRDHSPTAIVEGPDFRFGRGRSSGVEALREMGGRMGFETIIVEPREAILGDMTATTASSTLVRWLLRHGRVCDAASALGRPYEMEGVCVRGARRGREIGMPTINLSHETLAPADGVYAGVVALPSGERLNAAISVGTNPTFDGVRRSVEAHAIGWTPGSGPGSPEQEYGWPVAFEFHRWLRDQARFGSVGALMSQMRRDVARTLDLAGEPAAEAFA